jgi:hypothetical protein
MRKIAYLVAVLLFGAAPSYALDKIEGKEYVNGEYQHGTWPYTVLSSSCEKPHYLLAGPLQGAWYAEGWYCMNLSVLWPKAYVPRVMLGHLSWETWAP